MPKLLLTDKEQARVDAARTEVERLGLRHSDIAGHIGRGRQNVCEVLNGTIWSPGTLALVESLIRDQEALSMMIGKVASPDRSSLTSTGAGQKDQEAIL